MADSKISALTAVTAPASTDVTVVVNAGVTKKVTLANLVANSAPASIAIGGATTISVGATTTAATDLLINPTTKASGNLIDAQVNSGSKFSVDFAGVVTATNLKVSSNTRPQAFFTFNGTDGIHVSDATNGGKGWEVSASQFVANALEFTPATANGGTTYTTPVLSLLPGTVAMGKTVPAVIGTGATHGQSISILQGEELLTIAASPTTATTMQIPINAVILAVSVRVTTVIPTAATFTVTGTSSGTTFNTAAVSTAATSTDPGTKAGAVFNVAAQTITITPNLTPGTATGVVRVTAVYYLISIATS